MFEIEDNIPIPSVKGPKDEIKEALKKTLLDMQDKQSVFIPHIKLSYSTILNTIIKPLRKEVDPLERQFILKQIEKNKDNPIKGTRLWVEVREEKEEEEENESINE